jgi:hypothetical protein
MQYDNLMTEVLRDNQACQTADWGRLTLLGIPSEAEHRFQCKPCRRFQSKVVRPLPTSPGRERHLPNRPFALSGNGHALHCSHTLIRILELRLLWVAANSSGVEILDSGFPAEALTTAILILERRRIAKRRAAFSPELRLEGSRPSRRLIVDNG